MKTIILFILILFHHIFLGQETNCKYYFDSIVKQNVYTNLDSSAKFNGGNKEYSKYILDNIKPKTVTESQTKIRFFLIIDEKGKVIYVGFYKKFTYKTSMPDQIRKAFLNTKKWHPAKCNGKKVLYRFEGVYLI